MNSSTVQRTEQLSALERRLAQLQGERRALEARKSVLERDVGLAKGRLAQKSRVDRFLEELQAEAHARRVGDFERLLTALVSEVLPKEAPIGLQLEIERGQPSLDIVSRHSADIVEDIYDDQGGALTNVVSLGLRMISVVRSGMQRFLMLDESDCWISNQRVPAFYSVLKEASRKVDVQCLAVSHHDIAAFGEGITTASLTGHPEASGGVRIENSPRPYRWADDEEGIRWIRLRNFQGYIDETLHLSPGVNALTGENNIGKSSFVRAFRAVFYGEARDSLIRRGERQCVVEIGFHGGKTLRWDRQIRRNPINLWKLLGPDGSVISEKGMTYETGGRTVPDWVRDIFKIGPVEGLDVHAVKQKSPVFLLDKPGSTRAAVLSIGQESGHIRKMVSLHKEACVRDTAMVKEGEAEMATIQRRLERLERLGEIEAQITKARGIHNTIGDNETRLIAMENAATHLKNTETSHQRLLRRSEALGNLPSLKTLRELESAIEAEAKLCSALDHLEETKRHLDKLHARKEALRKLPDALPRLAPEVELHQALDDLLKAQRKLSRARRTQEALAGLPAAMPDLESNESRIRAGKALKEARLRHQKLLKVKAALEALPAALPTLIDTTAVTAACEDLEQKKRMLKQAQERREATMRKLDELAKEAEQLLEGMGGACPTCGQGVSDAAIILEGHSHKGARNAQG